MVQTSFKQKTRLMEFTLPINSYGKFYRLQNSVNFGYGKHDKSIYFVTIPIQSRICISWENVPIVWFRKFTFFNHDARVQCVQNKEGHYEDVENRDVKFPVN